MSKRKKHLMHSILHYTKFDKDKICISKKTTANILHQEAAEEIIEMIDQYVSRDIRYDLIDKIKEKYGILN